jgi:hypothetical protein
VSLLKAGSGLQMDQAATSPLLSICMYTKDIIGIGMLAPLSHPSLIVSAYFG